jgi:hypothetical protein
MTNGSPDADNAAITGTHATKWPLSAEEASPAGLSLEEV